MLKYFKKNKGFTLIELLVVIAIIAVLASIVLVSLNTARIKGRDARRIADIKSLQVALEMYYDGVGAGVYSPALADLKTSGYIPAIPTDPKDGTGYKYARSTVLHSTGLNKSYHLGAIMEGISGTEGALGTDVDNESATNQWATGDVAYVDGTDCTTTLTAGGTDKCYDVTN